MEKMTCYRVGENDIFLATNTDGIVSFNTSVSISILEKISSLEYRTIVIGDNIVLESVGGGYKVIIEDFKELFKMVEFAKIKKNIANKSYKYGIDYKTEGKIKKKVNRSNKYANGIVRKGIPIIVAGAIGLGIVSFNKGNDNIEDVYAMANIQESITYTEPLNNNKITKDDVEEISEEVQEEASIEDKLSFIQSYYNISSKDEFDSFINYIYEENKGLYTMDELVDALYDVCMLPISIKEQSVLNKYMLTSEKLIFVTACAIAEAKGDGTNYIDAYAVASTIYNRRHDREFVREVTDAFKGVEENAGLDLYYQLIHKDQFQVYSDGRYKNFLSAQDSIGYKAVIDMLYSGISMHSKIFFLSAESNPSEEYVQFVSGGNKYFTDIPEDRKIVENEKTL